jgi:hypothetical protein
MEPVTVALGIAKLLGLDKKIGSLLGGAKGAEVASKVLDMAEEVTGSRKPETIEQVLKNNPEQAAKLAEQLHAFSLREMELVFADITNARNMQVEALQQDDVFAKRFLYVFALAWSLFAMLYMFCVTFYPIPEQNVRFADSMQTFILSTVVATIIYFFFGSSRSSSQKDETVMAAVRTGK